MNLDDVDLTILRHLESSRQSLKPLFVEVPKSTAYERLRKLTAAGLISKKGKRWGVMPLGRQALEETRRGSAPARAEPDIAEAVPHVDLAPTRVHRAEMTLIAAAIAARKHGLSGSHHATFLLMGPKLTWKTWVAEMACLMVGIDPARFVLNMAVETPGSLIQRRGATGRILTKRLAISQSIVGLDELGRATPEVLRIAKVLFGGEIETPFENEMLEIRCVPVVTSNPKTHREGAELTEILGLDEGTIRRCVIADLKGIEIPADILTEGDSRLDRARALGPAEFPVPQYPDWLPSMEVQRHLQNAFDRSERLADVDFSMVALLCTGLTAWLSREAALYLGVKSYLEIVEPLGWLRATWQETLPPPGEAEDPSAAPAVREEAPNPFDYTAKARFMLSSCKRLGVGPDEAAELLNRLERLGPDKLARLERLDSALSEAGLKMQDVEVVIAAGRDLATATVAPGSRGLEVLHSLVRTMLEAFPDDLAAGERLTALEAVTSEAADVGRLQARARALEAETRELERGRTEAAASLAAEEQQLPAVHSQRKEAEQTLAATRELLAAEEERLTDLEAMCAERDDDIARAREHVRLLSGELALDGPFAKEVSRAHRARRIGTKRAKRIGICRAGAGRRTR